MPTIAEYAACATDGLSAAETAVKLGVGPTSVNKVARKYGLTFARKARRPFARALILQAADMHAGGMRWAEIAKALDVRKVSIQTAVLRVRDEERNRATPKAARSDGAHLPGGNHAVGVVAPICRAAVSLMQRGLSAEKAVEQIEADRKAKERRETSVGAPVPVIRFNSGPYKLGQSLHANNMEQSECNRPGAITTRSNQIRPEICGAKR